MEDDNDALADVYDAPLRVGGGDDVPFQLLGLLQPRGRRFRAAAYLAAWGVAGVLSTTIPQLAANRELVMVYFLLLMAGVLLVLSTVAAPEWPMAERAAARLEGLAVGIMEI